MGQQAVGDITNNDDRFSSMCEENDFVLVRTLFIYINKLTWTSPNGNTKSQINKIMETNGSILYRKCEQCAMMTSFAMARIRLKLRKTKIGTNKSKQFDVAKLKDPGVREQCTIRNRYNIPQDETAIAIDQSMGRGMMLLQKP